MACITSIFAQSFNFTFGLGRLFNLAHVSTYAVGAYAAALIPPHLAQFGFEPGFIFILLISSVVAAIASAPLAAIATRLTGDYFAIGTLALTYLVANTITNWRGLTNGVLGIAGIPRAKALGVDTNDNFDFLLVAIVIAALIHVTFQILKGGALGRRLRATGEFPHAAAALGISPLRTRGVTFVIGAAVAGVAGALYAMYISFIDPSSFGLEEMVSILTIVILGGPGSVVGCILATIGIIGLGEAMRFIPFAPSELGPARQIVYGILLFLVLAIRKDKLFPSQRTV